MTRHLLPCAAGLVFLAVAPASAQPAGDAGPAFHLWSSQVFTTTDRPSFSLTYREVDHLDFRVYRVAEPFAFFASLPDPHQLGSEAPIVPQERSPIERIAAWKAGQRKALRSFVRRQVSREYRAKRREARATRDVRRRVPLDYNSFAQVPLLNPSRLVASWRELLPPVREPESRRIPLDVSAPGVYVVEAVGPPLKAYTIVIVSDVALVTKTAPGQALVYAVDRGTGEPQAGCGLRTIVDGRPLEAATTGADGTALVAIAQPKPDTVIALATCEGQVAVTDPGSWALQAPARELVGYLYTDKPVYRPGHTVRMKGVLRWRTAAGLEPFGGSDVELSVTDSNDKVVLRERRPVDAFGSVSSSFALPAGAALGGYVVTAASGDERASGSFEVQEYRKPEFEVTVTAADRFVVQGGAVEAVFKARYYFGQPVAGGSVTYVVHRQPYYSPLRWSDDGDDTGGWWGGGEESESVTVRLDDAGTAAVSIPLPVDDDGRDYTARIEARVTDASNREVAGHAFVHATWGRFLVVSDVDRYVQKPGSTAQVSIRAVDYEGVLQAGVALHLALERLKYPQGRWNEPQVTIIASGTATTDEQGRASWSAALPQEPGSYRFRVSAESAGRRVEDTSGVWVTGSADEFGGGDTYLELVADRASYAPGDTARLVVRGGAVSAPVLVTKEARQISFHRVVRTGGEHAIEVPVSDADLGDTYVNIAYVKDDRLYRAEKRLKVPAVSRRLNVAVAAESATAKPREAGVFTLTVTDASGAPVRAQLSVGVIDEAVYGVKPDDTPDALRFFHRLSYSRVSTDYSRDYSFVGYAGSHELQLAQRRRPYTLADFKQEGPPRPQVRKDFPDAIFWAADVTTDAQGRATVRVPYPDALTTWRLTARAVTADTLVGAGLARTTTTKDLILRVVTPRFLTEADRIDMPVIVHNYLPDTQAVKVTGEVEGLTFAGGDPSRATPQTVEVPAGAERALAWTIDAPRAGAAVVSGTAAAAADADAIQLSFPVLPFGLQREEGRAGSMRGAGEQVVEVDVPASSNPSERAIRVQVAPSLGGPILAALDFLTSYPYGCTEQTVSSLLPNLVARRTLTDLQLPLTEGLKSLDRQVTEGLARLLDSQHEDGGWGWWKTDQNHPFMTAYAITGLLEARAAGYKVEEWPIRRGVRALGALYAEYPAALPDLKAYETYVLLAAAAAGFEAPARGEGKGWSRTAALDDLWSARDRMSAYGRSLLLLALDAAKDARGDALARDVASRAERKGDLAWWTSANDPLLFDFVDTSVEATALAAQALAARDPKHPLIEPAVRWLLLNRTFGTYWASTKQTAIVLLGLLDLMKARRETGAPSEVEVVVNGASIGTHRFAAGSLAAPDPVAFSVPAQAGRNTVRLVTRGEGAIYWSVQAAYYDTGAARERTGSHALALQREYFSLAPVTVKGRVVYRATALRGPAQPGDLLLVRLTAAGARDWRYLVLEDPIPAGTEPIQRDDLYQLERGRTDWWGSRREFRDSRAVFFQERFDQGRYEYSYLLKVIAPGTFRASPARISAMYVPDGFASSAAAEVVVRSGAPPAEPAASKGGRQ
ncbi:MAG TPA: MG2 domain-containing protein [Vicinamibacterales bacterium]|nr:MG2 domain-containing protein [Vicinamibacterales bacterium]